MIIRHFDFNFFLFFAPGIFTTWGKKIITINTPNWQAHIFYRFVIETAGTWHEMAIELTQEIGGAYYHYHGRHPGGSQHSFSNAFPWLCKEEMRFLSATSW